MKCARPHFHVIRLQDHATIIRPILLEGQNEGLERPVPAFRAGHVRHSIFEAKAAIGTSRQGPDMRPAIDRDMLVGSARNLALTREMVKKSAKLS